MFILLICFATLNLKRPIVQVQRIMNLNFDFAFQLHRDFRATTSLSWTPRTGRRRQWRSGTSLSERQARDE